MIVLLIKFKDPMEVSMSLSLLGRGNYSINDMRNYTEKLKTKLHFANWSTKAVKVGLCNVPPKGLDFSMLSLCNTSSISNLFQEVLTQFVKLYNRKVSFLSYCLFLISFLGSCPPLYCYSRFRFRSI